MCDFVCVCVCVCVCNAHCVCVYLCGGEVFVSVYFVYIAAWWDHIENGLILAQFIKLENCGINL